MENTKNHYLLGFTRRKSGAFEHAWKLAQNLDKKGYKTKYYACWWDTPVSHVNLKTEVEIPESLESLKNMEGIIHLQTHTWEYNDFLEIIGKKDGNIMIYNLHAIIPYYHMSEKDKLYFIEGKLPELVINQIMNKLSEREKSQLSAISKADYLITISKKHREFLEIMGAKKPIHVFENVTEVYDVKKEIIEESLEEAKKLRDSFEAENVLLYCGRLYPKKGSFGLFDSFKKIKNEYPSSKLVLLGAHEGMAEEMASYGLDKKNLENVVFVPWIKKSDENEKKIWSYFLACDVLIQPMITPELYSRAVVDAMALGIPAITCKSPYTIGSSENSQKIFESFVKMKENPEETARIVQKAKIKAMHENTWNSYISRLEDIISG